MGGSNYLSVKKDFSGPVEIAGVRARCYLYQAGGILVIEGENIETKSVSQIMKSLVSERLDINPRDWGLPLKKRGTVKFLKK